MAQGNIAEAAEWARDRRLAGNDEPAYPREPEYLALARLLLAGQHPGAAVELLERWLTLAVAQGRTGSVIALQVLALLGAGHPNRAIADQLVITLDTVKRHVSHLFGKLGVANRTQAVARARQLGLLP